MAIVDLFNAVLRKAVELQASDVHITAGSPFRLRLHGTIVGMPGMEPLKPQDTAAIAASLMISAKKATLDNVKDALDRLTEFDCSYALPGHCRFRVNICSQRGTAAIVLRAIPFRIPDFDELGLPRVLRKIALEERGLVLLTGVTGSGKTTTLASMISFINRTKAVKIITIEDPIEFLHNDVKAAVIQRELGADTESFARALRAALRQDPDVILVGEMRDRETIDTALKAAETGHLVFSTVHTPDAPKTIHRLLSFFDQSEHVAVRLRLAEALKAVISQRLMIRKEGDGRAVAVEVMRQTRTIQECIENPEKTGSIKDYLQKGREQYGMQTFDQHLAELYRAQLISLETAKAAATSAADFERSLQYQ